MYCVLKNPLWFPLLLLWVSYQALMPSEQVWEGVGWDKANHILAFFLLYACWDSGYRRPAMAFKFAVLVLYGIALELLQGAGALREASQLDVLADIGGLGLYVLSRWATRWFYPRGVDER